MAFNKEFKIDKERVQTFLKNALNKVMTEENPDTLNDLKKIFKQTIPFSKRMYVVAYLTKEMQYNFGSRINNRRYSEQSYNQRQSKNFKNDFHQNKSFDQRNSNFTSSHTEQSDVQTPHTHTHIDEEHAQTVFISIGRNRRVYPRDLITLLVSISAVERDRIGDIRVLSNYSFVQLFKEDTDKVISTLNGYDYRGRKLVVSYSREKDGENVSESSISDDSQNTNQSEESSSQGDLLV